MARFPGAAVLLILLVAVSMYGGTSLGRALEWKPDSVSISIRGLVEYFTKELSGAKEGGRDGDEAKVDRGARPARRHRPGTANRGVEVARPRRSSNFSGEITDAWMVKVGPWGGSGGQPFHSVSCNGDGVKGMAFRATIYLAFRASP